MAVGTHRGSALKKKTDMLSLQASLRTFAHDIVHLVGIQAEERRHRTTTAVLARQRASPTAVPRQGYRGSGAWSVTLQETRKQRHAATTLESSAHSSWLRLGMNLLL